MSTLKADAVTTKSDDTDLTITGGGTGVPNLEAGFKVGGTVGVPISGLQVGTDGELITWDASGDPAAVAVGTATHVLTSNGAGAAPTFQAAAAGGAWTFIGTSVASDSASLDITGLSNTYDTYACVAAEIVADGDNKWLHMRMGDGSFQTDNNYEFHEADVTMASNAYAANAGGDYSWYLASAMGNAAGEGANAVVFLSSGSLFPTIHGTHAYFYTDGTARAGGVYGRYNTVITEVDRVQIFLNSGNIATGRFSVYGIKHS